MKFYDTSALMCAKEIPDEPFATCSIVIQELEGIKSNPEKPGGTRRDAQSILSAILSRDDVIIDIVDKACNEILDTHLLDHTKDNLIIASAYRLHKTMQICFVTNDISQQLIAGKIFGFYTESISAADKNTHTCCIDIMMNNDEMAYFYEHPEDNRYGCFQNQYIAVRNSDYEVVDQLKWNGDKFVPLSYRTIHSNLMGKIQPRNPEQKLAFDLLQDPTIPVKVLHGKYGSGKDFLMISHALELINKGLYERLVYVRNTVEVKDSQAIGFLPGTMNEKLMPFAQLIADHVGGQMVLETLIARGTVELQHLGFIRGRDIKNSIIYCSEAENLSNEHVQLLLGRVGEGSALWINGDFRQVDKEVFRANSGLFAMVDRLRGNKNFGFVELTKTERSEVAALADLLD